MKTPTVVTRTNLTAADREASEPFEIAPGQSIEFPIIERLKLQDGMFLHERKKARLEEFCQARNFPAVKPFVLVSTKDIGHAKLVRSMIESASFFGGRYSGKVIEIHSKQSGEESDENVTKLLSVENPTNAVEVVVHVNMLKEGLGREESLHDHSLARISVRDPYGANDRAWVAPAISSD